MKKRIQRKLNSNKGLTLVEMLCSCLILVMLSTVVSTGLDMAAKSYGRMVAENEAQVLLSSVSTVLSDELRYAVGYPPDPPPPDPLPPVPYVTFSVTLLKGGSDKFVFESDTYWNNDWKTEMYIDSTGHLMAHKVGSEPTDDNYPMLPKSDYGNSSIRGAQYEIERIIIQKSSDNVFTYKITISRVTGTDRVTIIKDYILTDPTDPSSVKIPIEYKVKNMPHKP